MKIVNIVPGPRLKKLQESMVGGERVNDKELQERRLRKKKSAERRLNALARALANVETEEGPNLVLGVYDDIQEELRVKNEALKKYKQKVTRNYPGKMAIVLTCLGGFYISIFS